MLSEKIKTVLSHFSKYCECGVEIEPDGVRHLCDIFTVLMEDAQDMERTSVSPVAMAGLDLPANVIQLPRRGVA